MWLISYVTCVDIIAKVSLTWWSMFLFLDMPTLKLRIVIFPTNWPRKLLLTTHKTKYRVAFTQFKFKKVESCLGHFLDIPLNILLCNLKFLLNFPSVKSFVSLLPYGVSLISMYLQINIIYKRPQIKNFTDLTEMFLFFKKISHTFWMTKNGLKKQ